MEERENLVDRVRMMPEGLGYLWEGFKYTMAANLPLNFYYTKRFGIHYFVL